MKKELEKEIARAKDLLVDYVLIGSGRFGSVVVAEAIDAGRKALESEDTEQIEKAFYRLKLVE